MGFAASFFLVLPTLQCSSTPLLQNYLKTPTKNHIKRNQMKICMEFNFSPCVITEQRTSKLSSSLAKLLKSLAA